MGRTRRKGDFHLPLEGLGEGVTPHSLRALPTPDGFTVRPSP